MAGSSTYPTTVDNKTALQDGIDYIEADNVNNAYVPINTTQTFIGSNGKGASWSTDILDYLANTEGPILTKASASSITVGVGTVFIKSSSQANRLMRRNTSTVTVTSSNLDTGAMADDTVYYVYAVADSAAGTFTVTYSASSSAPTGATNYELIGWFYNESAGALDITSGFVGTVFKNGRRGSASFIVSGTSNITTTSTSLVDMTGMVAYIYSDGVRPTFVAFTAPFATPDSVIAVVIDIDAATKKSTEINAGNGTTIPATLLHEEVLSAGVHTVKIKWKVGSSTGTQNGSSDGERVMIVSTK